MHAHPLKRSRKEVERIPSPVCKWVAGQQRVRGSKIKAAGVKEYLASLEACARAIDRVVVRTMVRRFPAYRIRLAHC